MALITLNEALDFCGVDQDYFTVDAGDHTIFWKYDAGSAQSITLTHNTYLPSALASHIASLLDTLFTITSSCSWSTTTRKFTISVAAGHTIQCVVSGSTGALLIGFSSTPTAAVSIVSDQVALADPTGMVDFIKSSTEAFISSYCRRTFESTTYNEVYDGNGSTILSLKQYPITQITKLAIGTRNVVRIKNTNDNSTASVSVNSSGLVLVRNGVSDSTVTFASYATLSTMVTAINLISGWQAETISSTYDSFKSSDLIECYGLNAIDDNWVDLYIPEDAEDNFKTYLDRGQIYLSSGFPVGHNNIFVSYTAGESSIPYDLQLCCRILVKFFYQKWKEETYGLNNWRIGDISSTITETIIPPEARMILSKYRKVLV